ncbi:MAG: hypothetical protein MR900_10550 [Prevotella sp.]|nr:hypothetical protein [Prevotella sp.]
MNSTKPQRTDYISPVTIGNFTNCRSAVAKVLMAEAAMLLKDLGWENEFAIYYHGDRKNVRLYLRLAYVSAFYIDGEWTVIKARLPKLVPLLNAAIELRKEKNANLLWVEKDVKDLQWTKLDAPCLFCETYQTNNNLL